MKLCAVLLSLSALTACPTPVGPRYTVDPQRLKGLPTDHGTLLALSDELATKRPTSRQLADRSLAAAEAAEVKHPHDFDVLWRIARGTFLMTEHLETREQRLTYATRGREAAELAVQQSPSRVEGHYYLAMNIARIAEAKNKLGLIKVALGEAERSARIDPRFDEAGAYRFMGKLYLVAPAWPVSVGSTEKAVEMLERAVALAPIPINRLFLGQAYFKDDEPEKAKVLLEGALRDGQRDRGDPRWQKEAKEAEEYLRRLRSGS